jgi:zinc protease
MKHFALVSFFLGWFSTAWSQPVPTEVRVNSTLEMVPLDPEVVTGTFENGLKYYIRKNKKPESKVELRLVVNAGSILEEDYQRGLAHFCEHMAFNGTKHFEKNELVDYLQTAGVKFGAHLNAYTSFDETVYMLSLPSQDDTLVEKGFLVLEDWSRNLLFVRDEVDKERGVVLEEFRLGLGAQKRMMAKYLPVIFNGSRYAERLPIGEKEILENFDPEVLMEFYRDWYRPDLMAVVVVGDIEPNDIEEKIKKHFESWSKKDDAKQRDEFSIPGQQGYRASVNSDPEATYNSLQIFISQKSDGLAEGSMEEFKKSIQYAAILSMINERMNVLGEESDAPFSYANWGLGDMWGRNYTALQGWALVSDNKYTECIELLMSEILRAQAFGFSESEYERAKQKMLSTFERASREQDKTPNEQHARDLVEYFLSGSPKPEAQWKSDFARMVLEETPTPMLHELIRQLDVNDHGVVVITGTEKDRPNMPEVPVILGLMHKVATMTVHQNIEKELPLSLMTAPVSKGEAPKASELGAWDAKTFTLSNGAKVIYRKTELKNDEIIFRAISKGGTNLYDDKTFLEINNALSVIGQSGVGYFSRMDVSKILAGKKVSVTPNISSNTEGMQGSCSPEDIESLMQMVHLYFTKPRKDQDAYDVYVKKQRSFMDNMLSDPSSYFNQEWSKFVYQGHPRAWTVPSAQDWEKTSYDKIFKVYQERFANASDFTFLFVGNIDEAQLQFMCQQYLASLPSNGSKDVYKDVKMNLKKGTDRLNVYNGSEEKSSVRIVYSGDAVYSKKENMYLSMFGELLTIKLTEKLREEMSGVYGSGASGGLWNVPIGKYYFGVSFPCGPDNVEGLIAATLEEINILIENGPQEKDLNKVKQARLKEYDTDVQSNYYWVNLLQEYAVSGLSVSEIEETKADIERVKADDLKNVAKKYLSGDHLIGVLYPENTK